MARTPIKRNAVTYPSASRSEISIRVLFNPSLQNLLHLISSQKGNAKCGGQELSG